MALSSITFGAVPVNKLKPGNYKINTYYHNPQLHGQTRTYLKVTDFDGWLEVIYKDDNSKKKIIDEY